MSDVEHPSMHEVTGGRYEATCGKCLRHSVPVPAVDPAHAWEELKRIGWTYFWPYGNRNLLGYSLCPTCTKEPPDQEQPAKRKARRHR